LRVKIVIYGKHYVKCFLFFYLKCYFFIHLVGVYLFIKSVFYMSECVIHFCFISLSFGWSANFAFFCVSIILKFILFDAIYFSLPIVSHSCKMLCLLFPFPFSVLPSRNDIKKALSRFWSLLFQPTNNFSTGFKNNIFSTNLPLLKLVS